MFTVIWTMRMILLIEKTFSVAEATVSGYITATCKEV